jgi:hypothetical protein
VAELEKRLRLADEQIHQLVTHGGSNPTFTPAEAKLRREKLLQRAVMRLDEGKLRRCLSGWRGWTKEGSYTRQAEADLVAETFHQFDSDGGGSISRKELRGAMASLGVELSKRGMKQLMQRFDEVRRVDPASDWCPGPFLTWPGHACGPIAGRERRDGLGGVSGDDPPAAAAPERGRWRRRRHGA